MSYIVEYGIKFATTAEQLKFEEWLADRNISYYEEPPRANPYRTLEELEADCEGK